MEQKEKLTISITIGIICFILTAVLFVQFRTINQTDINSLERMREDELRTEISNFKLKYEEAEKKLEETNQKIAEYKETMSTEKEASEVLEDELIQLNNLTGKNNVKGEGVIITLTDTRYSKISAVDLLELVNELKMAGAEAISINNQRIVYDSYIVDINNTYISVNGERTVSPYIVKAIGNTKYLESGLSKKQYGYIDTKLSEGKDISLEKQTNIEIGKYEGDLKFSHAKSDK